jgi:hypothetical protein
VHTAAISPLVHLKSLVVRASRNVTTGRLLALTLQVPKLTKLHSLPRTPEIFVNFLSRLSAMLQDLSAGRSYHTLTAGLPLLPSLSVLSIDRMSMGEVTHILCSLRDSPNVLVNLTSLDIRIQTLDWPRHQYYRSPEYLEEEIEILAR